MILTGLAPWLIANAVTTCANAAALGLVGLKDDDRALKHWAGFWTLSTVIVLVSPLSTPDAPTWYGAIPVYVLTCFSWWLIAKGTSLFVEEPLGERWRMAGMLAVVAGPLAGLAAGPLALVMPTMTLHLFAVGWTGWRLLVGHPHTIGGWTGGASMLMMAVHAMAYPLVVALDIEVWGYLLMVFLQIMSVVGLLILYYERAAARLQETERSMQRSRRTEALGRIAGGVAHDFNNILMICTGNLEVLRTEADPAVREAALEEAQQALQHAARLTAQLLTYGKQAPVRSEGVDPHEVVQRTVQLLEPVWPQEIQLVQEFDGSRCRLLLDQSLLEQIVLNLVTNARDALESGGEVLVRTQQFNDGRLFLEVRDDGPGIAPHTLERMFEPFFSTKTDGSGLGLATVQGAVEQLGGTIQVHTKRGQGTRFLVELPARLVPDPVTSAPASAADTDGDQTILLVDDEAAILRIMTRILTRKGHRVLTAKDGQEAMAVLSAEPSVNLVISDIRMPGVNGLQLHNAMKEQWPTVPLVLMSGNPGDLDADARALRYLQKPFSQTDLVQTVNGFRDIAAK